MGYKLKSFGGVDLPRYHTGQQPNEVGTATVRDMLMPVVGGYFDTHFDGSTDGDLYGVARPIEPMTLNYSTMIVGELPRRFLAQYHELTALVGKRGKLVRVDDLGNEQWLWAVLLGITPARKTGDLLQDMRFQFRLPTPVWRGEYVTFSEGFTGDNSTINEIDVPYDSPAPAQGLRLTIYKNSFGFADELYKIEVASSEKPRLSLKWLDETGYALGNIIYAALADAETWFISDIEHFSLTNTFAYTGTGHGHKHLLELSRNRKFYVLAHGHDGSPASVDGLFELTYYKGYW